MVLNLLFWLYMFFDTVIGIMQNIAVEMNVFLVFGNMILSWGFRHPIQPFPYLLISVFYQDTIIHDE